MTKEMVEIGSVKLVITPTKRWKGWRRVPCLRVIATKDDGSFVDYTTLRMTMNGTNAEIDEDIAARLIPST